MRDKKPRVTKHGQARMMQRLGLPLHITEAEAARVYRTGRRARDFKGRFRRYLDSQTKTHKSTVVVHGNALFFFYGDMFITCYPVPGRFNKYLKDAQHE